MTFFSKVWFQNRRAKWKKRKKSTNIFRQSYPTDPSPSLTNYGCLINGTSDVPIDHPLKWSHNGPPTAPHPCNQFSFSSTNFQMDPSLVSPFYSSDYVSAPAPPASATSSSFFSATLPSIINIDPLHSCSTSSTTYNLPFSSTNDVDDLWRGSSIASLRRKAVEYQASSISQYK